MPDAVICAEIALCRREELRASPVSLFANTCVERVRIPIVTSDVEHSGDPQKISHVIMTRKPRPDIGAARPSCADAGNVHADITSLVDRLEGEARAERESLIGWLVDRGFDVDQIRDSLSPMLLPANRVFGDTGTFVSAKEVADSGGVPVELVQRLHRAAGLARVDDPSKAMLSRADAASVLPAAALVHVGIDPDQVVQVVRLLMEGLTHAAVAMRRAALQALLRPGTTELELAQAFEALAQDTQPLIDPIISELSRLALRHTFETEAVSAAERAAGTLPGARLSPWHSPIWWNSRAWAKRCRPRNWVRWPNALPT